jgi:hypothetical protein
MQAAASTRHRCREIVPAKPMAETRPAPNLLARLTGTETASFVRQAMYRPLRCMARPARKLGSLTTNR